LTEPYKSQLGIFAKYWEPGQVKTRLASDTSNLFAARVYQAFLEATLETASGLAERQVLAFTPADRVSEFACCLPPHWTLTTQSGDQLGERMTAYFTEAFEHDIEKVILIGSDSPHLPREVLQQAFQQLDVHRCVLGPARDGGYYLIGARNLIPPVFTGIDWSTDQVMQQTVEQLQAANISYGILPTWYDIDTIDDLEELQHDLQSGNHWLYTTLQSLRQEHLS